MVLFRDAIILLPPLISHSFAGMYAAPIKWKRIYVAGIWAVWTVLMLCLLPWVQKKADPGTPAIISNFAVMYLGQITIFLITTKGNLLYRLFLISTYSVIFTIYSSFCAMLWGGFEEQHPLFFLMHLVLLILMDYFYLKEICERCREASKYMDNRWASLMAVNFFLFLTVVALTVYPNTVTDIRDPAFPAALMLFLTAITMYPILFRNIRNVIQLEEKKRENIHGELLLAQVSAQEKELEYARRSRHDQRHHHSLLLTYAKDGDLEAITAYLEAQMKDTDIPENIRFCENNTINNILRVYHQKTSNQGIQMKIRASVRKTLAVTAPDLVKIIANLLENALHGALASGVENPRFWVSVYHKDDHLVIRCENSCVKTLDFADMPDSLWGVGIKSICSTVDKYNGNYRFSAENGLFSCIIVIST